MSSLDDLTAACSPDGVEFRTLGELGTFVRGSGIQKSDFTDVGVGCIHYGEVHTHYGTWATETKSFVDPQLVRRLKMAAPGDLVIATTSEDDAAVGKAVAWLGDGEVAVSTDAYIYKHSMDPRYVAYFFQSDQFRTQKMRHITGAKVRRLSGGALEKIRIPVPPVAVQREIANTLDRFADLEAELAVELEAELAARRLEYDHYRASLLTFDDSVTLFLPLGDLAEIGTGSSNTNEALSEGAYPFFVRSQEVRFKNEYEFDETAVITSGDGVGVGKVYHFVQGPYALHQRAYRINPTDDRLLPKFLFQLMRQGFREYILRAAVHSSVTSVRRPMLVNYPVPLPAQEEQQRIVELLDKLDGLWDELSCQLRSELSSRRKQYEYWRDRLLTFEEAA